jgi:hypothetical protein
MTVVIVSVVVAAVLACSCLVFLRRRQGHGQRG